MVMATASRDHAQADLQPVAQLAVGNNHPGQPLGCAISHAVYSCQSSCARIAKQRCRPGGRKAWQLTASEAGAS